MFYTQGLVYFILTPIFAVLSAALIIVLSKVFRNRSEESKLKPIRWIFFILLALEIAKIFILIRQDGEFKPLRFPIVFCSIVLYAYPLFCFKQNRLSNIGKSLSIIPAFIAGLMFIILPGTLSFDTATNKLITFHSFFFHYAMISVAIYMIITKIANFEFKQYFSLFLALAAYLVMAVSVSLFIGGDISLFGPDSAYLGFLYNMFGYIPASTLLIIFCFGLSIGIYGLINLFRKKEKLINE